MQAWQEMIHVTGVALELVHHHLMQPAAPPAFFALFPFLFSVLPSSVSPREATATPSCLQ